METIRAEIIPRKELFRDKDSGFKIYSADIVDKSLDIETNNYGNISIKGNNLPDFNLDSTYDLELHKNSKEKYKGSYTMIKSYFVKPQSPEEQWKFLKMVVTETQYNSISGRYVVDVDNIIDIIMNDEFDYTNVNGYGEETYKVLKKKVDDDLNISEALAYFSEYEISYNTVKRMVGLYGSSEKAIEEIEKNPYAIIEKDGFGFIKADDLAMKLGIPKDSKHRIESCMIYILDEVNADGDIWITRKKLYNKMKKYLMIDKKHIDEVLDEKNPYVFVYKDRYASYNSAKNEFLLSAYIANKVLNEESLLSIRGYNPDSFIDEFEQSNNISLSDEQREFFHKLDKSNVSFLVGNAGSGKSMSMKIVTSIAEKLGLSVALLSPTGKASRVLTEYTGKQAYTIHKKLGYGKSSDEGNTLIQEDIILVDEASMSDIRLARNLMSKVKKGALIVFIGDDAQIPSVGEGNFLYDCINCDMIPRVKLTKVFRQKESGMLNAITRTRKGRAFLNTQKVGSQRIGNNFEFRHMMKEQIVENLIISYKKMLKNGYSFEDIAILVPTNIGDVGTININNSIQEVVNPQNDIQPKDEHVIGGKKNRRILRVGDYVMNTENMYDAPVVNKAITTDVFNGESGTIIAVNTGNKEIVVDFEGNHVLYSFSDATKKLNHSWAVTTYKAQGSQYRVVLAVVDASATYQLNANLLYTAMSRAREFLGIFGQAKTFNRAIKKFANFDRNSFLGEFLELSFEFLKDGEKSEEEQKEMFLNL